LSGQFPVKTVRSPPDSCQTRLSARPNALAALQQVDHPGRAGTFAVHGRVLVPAVRCAVDWQAGRRVEGATRVILDEIRAMGPQLAELCRKYGIAELSVFGSVARGDAQPGSDVDLLYVRVPGNDLGMSYFALQEDLEKLFGRPVDLVPKEGLHRVIRDQVLSDAQVLYAA
jgi:uncharacterized protein